MSNVRELGFIMETIMKTSTSGLLGLSLILFIVVGCGGGKPVATKYQGDWVAENGTTLYMYEDGKAGFKKGGKSGTGGSAEIDETAKTLTISLLGISETWKIDQEPSERGEMILSGVKFRRKS